MPHIQISACTYRRPDGLRALFDSLHALHIPEEVDVSVCIVDNDTAASARDLVSTLGDRFDLPVRYAHESRPGIPMARNRALDEAFDADFVAFIDDDETVDPDWLIELWRMRVQTGAEFVQGPVRMTVEDPADAWWLETIFFHQKEFADGAPRNESWSNNVLIDMAFLRQAGLRFDEALALDGGEDTLFFQDMVRAGAKGVFASNAWVQEVQPESRLTWSWGRQRQFRAGITRANTYRMRRGAIETVVYCCVRGTGMAVVGTLHLITTLWRGRRGVANAVALWCRAAGVFAGLFGRRHLEYARSETSPAQP